MITPDHYLNLRPGVTVLLEEFLERGEELLAATPPEGVTTIRDRTRPLRVITEDAYEQLLAQAEWAATLDQRVIKAKAAAEAYKTNSTSENEAKLQQALEGVLTQ